MTYKPKKTLIALALSNIFVGSLVNAADDTSQSLDALVIQETKEVSNFDEVSISKEEIDTRKAFNDDASALLDDVAGVARQSAGGVSSLPVIHGLADDRLRIKVDGMDLVASCPNHMNSPLSYISPSAVENITVYKGVSPVSVGGDSIGGSIVVESKTPKFAKEGQSLTEGEVGAFYQSNGAGHRENLTFTHATDKFNVTYRGSAAEAENYNAGGDFKTRAYATNPNGWQAGVVSNGSTTSPTETGWMNNKKLGLSEVGSSAYKSYNQEIAFAFKLNRDLLELKYGYQHIPYELYPNQRMDMLDNEQKRINVKYLGDFNWGTLEARAYNETTNHYMDFGADKQFWYGYNAAYTYNPATNNFYLSADPTKRAFVATGMPMYTKGNTMGATLKADVKLKDKETLRIGADFQQYKLDDWWPAAPANDGAPYYNSTGAVQMFGGMYPNTFWNLNNGRRDRLALWSELETQQNKEWRTLFGARVEQVTTNADNAQGYNTVAMMKYGPDADAFNAKDHKRTDTNLDLSALAKYTPSATQSYDFGLARKTRSPNLYERYSWSTNSMALIMNNWVGDGNGYLGDPDLKPETAHTASMTASYHDADKTWEFNVTPHFSLVDNYIDAVRLPNSVSMMGVSDNNTTSKTQFIKLKYANQAAQLYGLDINGRMPLAKNDLGQWGLKGSVSYVRGLNLDTNDGLYNVMPLTARAMLTQQYKKWSNGLEFVWVADKTDISSVRNEIETAGYSLWNLRSSYNWNKSVRLDFGVENLLDTLYYAPLGGAYSGQGTTMSMQGIPYGLGVPGMGRSVYTGVTVKF